jgi:hypothetical protein
LQLEIAVTRIKQAVVTLSCVCLLGAGFVMPAQAALIGSGQIVRGDSAVRSKIDSWLARDEIRSALAAQGVDRAELQARVAALGDDEARDLAARIDQLPAGGDGGEVLGILFAVFVILLITDILGLTKVFPFTRPIRR